MWAREEHCIDAPALINISGITFLNTFVFLSLSCLKEKTRALMVLYYLQDKVQNPQPFKEPGHNLMDTISNLHSYT